MATLRCPSHVAALGVCEAKRLTTPRARGFAAPEAHSLCESPTCREEGTPRLEFVPFRPEHLGALRLQAAQAYLQPLLARPEYGTALAGPNTWSGTLEGRIAGCAGILPQWPGRAIAWALLTRNLSARHFLRAHHKVLSVLLSAQRSGAQRIETTVDSGFDAGHRWVRALGFRPEGLMRCFSPEGRDHVLYARIHDAASPKPSVCGLQTGLQGAMPLAIPANSHAVSRAQALSPLGETPTAREEGALSL